MRVEVYWNLHKHLFSVRALEGKSKGRVVEHVESLRLMDASFHVQPAGRAKVLRTKRKTVHAFVRGRVLKHDWLGEYDQPGIELTYNPYKYSSFVTRGDERPVVRAGGCSMSTVEQHIGEGCDPVRKARIVAHGLVELKGD